MKLAQIRAIAAATTISLAGLLVLQGQWLRRGYRDTRATFERRVDLLLASTAERIDSGDELSRQITTLAEAANVSAAADTAVAHATLGAIRGKIDLDLARASAHGCSPPIGD